MSDFNPNRYKARHYPGIVIPVPEAVVDFGKSWSDNREVYCAGGTMDGWDDGCVDFVLGLSLPELDWTKLDENEFQYIRSYRAAQSLMECRRLNAGEVMA